jgi:hypothetical protein
VPALADRKRSSGEPSWPWPGDAVAAVAPCLACPGSGTRRITFDLSRSPRGFRGGVTTLNSACKSAGPTGVFI